MIKYIKQCPTIFDKNLNKPLLNKFYDRSLLDYVLDSWKSLQILKGIDFLGYDYIEHPSEIEINKYIFKRQKGKSKNEKYDYKYIDDNKVGLLTVYLKLSNYEMDFSAGKKVKREKNIKKHMLIPLIDDDGFAFIKGKKYYFIYQLLEKSTYTSASSVILKSLMPFSTSRKTITKEDMEGNMYTLPYYNVVLYKNVTPVMLIYAAHSGLDFAVQFSFDCFPYAIMKFVEVYDKEDKDNIYFGISKNLFLRVNKKLFDKYLYVKSVVGGIMEICNTRTTYDKLNDTNAWIKKLSHSNIEKGESLLMSLQRLIDETVKKVLKTDMYNKLDVLNCLRWMTQEFNELRAKDNMDLCNKRLRCNEYISALLTQNFSERINFLITLGNKVTIENLKDIFKFSPELLIQRMHASGIFKYDECINDLDMISRVRFTTKGPHSAGMKNKNSIGTAYRGLHPSYIGYIDLTTCGNSDPGTSGVLTPFNDMKSLYFDDSDEPDGFKFDLINSVKEILKEQDTTAIWIDVDNKEDYYDILRKGYDFSREGLKIYCTTKNNYEIIVENDEDLDSDEPKPKTENK